MKNEKIPVIIYLLVSLSMVLGNCAALIPKTQPALSQPKEKIVKSQKVKKYSASKPTKKKSTKINKESTVIPKKKYVQETVFDTLERIDSLAKWALVLCSGKYYSDAHQTLTHANELLNRLKERAENITYFFNAVFEKIANVYLNELPDNFLDSISPQVSSSIFRCQIEKALNIIPLNKSFSTDSLDKNCKKGEAYNIPIIHNYRVHRALSCILTQRRKTLTKFLKRTYYYIPYVKKQYALHGLPTDLCFLPVLESGYNPRAYSFAHAAGIWQFITSTGHKYGLRKNYWIDERMDPQRSTLAAINYLKKLYADFDDWYLALAAYNCGENRVARAITRAGSNDFWKLQLPRETMNYVPQFIAYQMIAKNPTCFDFDKPSVAPYDIDTAIVSYGLDLYKVAKEIGLTYKELKDVNPHIKQYCTPPFMKDVTLYLPKGYIWAFKSYVDNLSDKDRIVLYRYRIRGGDNLYRIAKRFNISVGIIKSLNNLLNNYLVSGRYLYIPISQNRPTANDKLSMNH